MLGGRRDVGLLAAATLVGLLLLGGAIAIGSGVVRLSLIVPPSPNTTLNTALITSPPSPSADVSPSPTPGLTPSGIGSGSWSVTGLPHHSGCCRTATLLSDGRVLLAGGQSSEAELYDPATGHWTETGRMHVARSGHIASLLADGRVLVAGGIDSPKGYLGPLASAELYDPISGTWTETGSMTRWRYYSEAISLADGRVLVVGGHVGDHVSSKRIPPGGGEETKSAETYDPASGTWTLARPMTAPPGTATLLPDGTVLVTHDGGSSELFDPRTGRWTATPSPTQPLYAPRATLLANGDVLVVALSEPARGSGCPCRQVMDRAELYDPLTGSWTPTGRPPAGSTEALLADGMALVFGDDGAAARYDPRNGSWATGTALPREWATTNPDNLGAAPNYWDFPGIAIRLLDGRVLTIREAGAALFDPNGTR
jgi:hypothetical protein